MRLLLTAPVQVRAPMQGCTFFVFNWVKKIIARILVIGFAFIWGKFKVAQRHFGSGINPLIRGQPLYLLNHGCSKVFSQTQQALCIFVLHVVYSSEQMASCQIGRGTATSKTMSRMMKQVQRHRIRECQHCYLNESLCADSNNKFLDRCCRDGGFPPDNIHKSKRWEAPFALWWWHGRA